MGTELVPFHVPMKPNVVVAPAARVPFQAAFDAVTVAPLLVSVAAHAWVIVWPLAYVHDAVQPLIAEAPAVTVTSPWKPPGHSPAIRYVAEHAPPGTTADVGGRDVTTTEVGGRDVTTTDVGGREVTTTEVGGREVTTPDVGGRDVTTTEVGGREVTTPDVGGRDVTTTEVGGREVADDDVGVTPPMAAASGAYHLSAIFVMPAGSEGCTPS